MEDQPGVWALPRRAWLRLLWIGFVLMVLTATLAATLAVWLVNDTTCNPAPSGVTIDS